MGCGLAWFSQAEIVFETTSPYHHIRVRDTQGMRTLLFDNGQESRISLTNSLMGHFEYTEYFHMPWLWNDRIERVLMIGLGGGTTALAWQHYYTNVMFEAVELDPKVVQVAKIYFHLSESPKLKIHNEDGRLFLRRNRQKYDVILLDAYTIGRYGSSIPYSLVTREFFALASDRLTPNGVLAYNVIGSAQSDRENIVSAIYKTMGSVFPRVHCFAASSSQNVILLATKSSQAASLPFLTKRWMDLTHSGWRTLPNFENRLKNYQFDPPPAAAQSRILTDDFAPTDGMLSTDSDKF